MSGRSPADHLEARLAAVGLAHDLDPVRRREHRLEPAPGQLVVVDEHDAASSVIWATGC